MRNDIVHHITTYLPVFYLNQLQYHFNIIIANGNENTIVVDYSTTVGKSLYTLHVSNVYLE